MQADVVAVGLALLILGRLVYVDLVVLPKIRRSRFKLTRDLSEYLKRPRRRK